MADESAKGPILRLFQVEANPGRASELVAKFATTSAAVVAGEPGNQGYFFGEGVSADGDYVIFASIWESLDAIKARFGDDWGQSFLPEGYEEMIETCSVRHVSLAGGWNVNLGD